MAYADVVMADAPICWWRGGVTAPPTVDAPLADASGNGHALRLWHNSGVPAYPADGASLITTDANPSMDMVPDSNFWKDGAWADVNALVSNFSLELWSKPRAGAISGGNARDLMVLGVVWSLTIAFASPNYVYRASVNRTLDGVTTVDAPVPVAAGQGSHLLMTYAPTALRLYQNGAQVAALPSLPASNIVTNSGNFALSQFSDASHAFDGLLDDVAIYPSTLSAARVAAHYTAATSAGGMTGATYASTYLEPKVSGNAIVQPPVSDLEYRGGVAGALYELLTFMRNGTAAATAQGYMTATPPRLIKPVEDAATKYGNAAILTDFQGITGP